MFDVRTKLGPSQWTHVSWFWNERFVGARRRMGVGKELACGQHVASFDAFAYAR